MERNFKIHGKILRFFFSDKKQQLFIQLKKKKKQNWWLEIKFELKIRRHCFGFKIFFLEIIKMAISV